jgi:hypothetical protein
MQMNDDSNDEKMIVTSEKLSNSNCKIFVLQYRKTIPDFILQPSGKVFLGMVVTIVTIISLTTVIFALLDIQSVPKANWTEITGKRHI